MKHLENNLLARLFRLLTFAPTLLMVALPATMFSQDEELVDSLKHQLAISKTDSARIFWLNKLTWVHISNDSHQAAKYNDESRKLAIQNGDEHAVARTHHYAGLIDRFLGNYPEAIQNLEKALQFYEDHNITNGASGALFNLGVVYSMLGNYEKSLSYYYRQMAIDEALGDTAGVGNTLNSIGSVNRKMGKFEDALKKYDRALEILQKHGDPWNVANVLSNIGGAYMDMRKPHRARKYFHQALEIDREVPDEWGIAYNLHRLGSVMEALGALDSAATYFQEALVLRRGLDQRLELSETMVAIGAVWFRLGQRQRGEEMINAGLDLSASIGAHESQTRAHHQLAGLYQQVGAYDLAFEHLKKYAELRDTVLNKEKLHIAADLEARYESARKDQLLAENELEIASANAKVQRQTLLIQMTIIGAGGLLIILILSLIVFNERRKRNVHQLAGLQREKELVALKSVMQGEEKERSRIARDLHDGLSSLLAAIKIQFNSLQHESEVFRQNRKFNEALKSLDDASKEVRRIAHNMMPELLMKYGLTEALSEFITHLNIAGERQIQFTHYGLEERLSPATELVLYRIIQELLNNIVKHSKATEVLVQINRHQDQLSITVEDNGIGFEPDDVQDHAGIGMSNLVSRIEYLNGELNIESVPDQGTSVYITMSLKEIPNET